MSSIIDLKPCPFCGGKELDTRESMADEFCARIMCECGVVFDGDDLVTVSAAWNRRLPSAMIDELDELERLAREAADEADGDWFSPDLIESNEPILSSRKARRYIAAASPDVMVKLVSVVREKYVVLNQE